MTQLALLLAEQIAPELALDPQLAYGFRLHDIGMIGVSNATLLKPGTLTPAELDEIREHPWLGERIVAPVPALGGLTRQVIACHHERWDGSGYPRGLRGTEIPLAARIFAVVDAFDAMTNDQPYRDALPIEEARRRDLTRRPGSTSIPTSSRRSSRSTFRPAPTPRTSPTRDAASLPRCVACFAPRRARRRTGSVRSPWRCCPRRP